MTTLLPKEQVDVLRSIGDAANVLMALFLIDRLYPGRSTTLQEFSTLLGKDKRVVEKRLQSLCGANRVVFDGHGYVLLEGGRALFLAAAPSLPDHTALDWDRFEDLAPSPATEQAPPAQAPGPTPVLIDADPAPEPPEDAEDGAHTMRALLEEEESLKLNPDSENSESSSEEHTKSAQPSGTVRRPTTLEILDATELLFEKTMTTRGLEHKPRRLAIGWVAQAWDQRRFLRSPQGLIFARLSADQMPQQKYYDHPRSFLPDAYLVQLGLMDQPPAEEDPEIPDPIELEPPVVDERAVRTWETVLGQLQLEMHAGPFNTWLRDTRPVRFDGNTLTIGTASLNSQEWLESRMTRTVERLLVGILGHAVTVQFVTTG